MADTYDLYIDQGATFERVITWKQTNGTPVDLTGYSARMQIRRTKSNETALVSLTNANGITLGGTSGTIAISISAAVTEALTFRRAVYDLELVSPNGSVYRLLQGAVALSKEVTR